MVVIKIIASNKATFNLIKIIDKSKIMEETIQEQKYYEFLDTTMRSEKQDITASVAYSAVECATRLKCKAIVTPTISGYTARKLSRFRPNCPIIAITPDIILPMSPPIILALTIFIEDTLSLSRYSIVAPANAAMLSATVL